MFPSSRHPPELQGIRRSFGLHSCPYTMPFWKITRRRQHQSYCLQSYQVRSCNDELN
nr:hypothetical protein Iba_chr10aCG6080 [Ipomoea batatas]